MMKDQETEFTNEEEYVSIGAFKMLEEDYEFRLAECERLKEENRILKERIEKLKSLADRFISEAKNI